MRTAFRVIARSAVLATLATLAWPATAQKTKSPFPSDEAALIVRGEAVYDGAKAPRPRRFRMEGDTFCETAHKGPLYLETLIVSKDLKIQNVFVYVKKGASHWSYPPPTAPVFIDQTGCIFAPHVLGIRVGQELVVRNSDKTNHNVHFVGMRNREWNKTQKQGEVIKAKFKRKEIMGRVKCDMHSWMGAYVGVLAHPFFAVTGADGKFELGKLPPGEYTIAAWHEKLGASVQTVVLKAGETPAPLTFKFKPKKARR